MVRREPHRKTGDTRTMTERGLGWDHQKERQRAKDLLVDGTPCGLCSRGMYHWQALDLDHKIPRALGGIGGPTRLVHRKCNRRAGARLGNKMRRRTRKVNNEL